MKTESHEDFGKMGAPYSIMWSQETQTQNKTHMFSLKSILTFSICNIVWIWIGMSVCTDHKSRKAAQRWEKEVLSEGGGKGT